MKYSLRSLMIGVMIAPAALVLYVLSDGPAWALMRRADSRLARTCYRMTYAPVNWVARQSPVLDDALTAHGQWWDRTLPNSSAPAPNPPKQ
jgi:hypothetical protein